MMRINPNLNKILLFLSILLLGNIALAQKVVLTPGTLGGSTSGGLGTTGRYAVNENLYVDSDFGTGGKAITITSMRIRVNAAFTTTPTGNNIFNPVKVSLKAVPSTMTTLNLTTPYIESSDPSSGYTTVFNGSLNCAGGNVIDVVIPMSAPFTKQPGEGILVLIERLDNFSHTVGNWQVVTANNSTATAMARRIHMNTAPVSGTTLYSAANGGGTFTSRALLTWVFNFVDPNADLDQVYTLGSLPNPYGLPHTYQASISNNAGATIYNCKAYLNITGVNTHTDSVTIDSIPALSRKIVSFPAWSPTLPNNGLQTVSVNIVPPAGAFSAKSTYSMDQQLTNNVYSLAYGFNGNPPVAAGGVGFNGATGDFIAKFYSDSPSNITQAVVNINSATSGAQPFKIGIWGDSGSGTPGTLLWESPLQQSSAGKFTIPVTPKIPVNGNFFVGVRQLGTTNIAFAYQSEAPPRAGNFFYTSPTGSTAWVDFATTNSPFRFLAEAKLELANDVGAGQITYPLNTSVFSSCDTIAPVALVANYGVFDQTDVPVTMKITDNLTSSVVYYETITLPSLLTGQSVSVTFPKTFVPVAGMPGTVNPYSAECFTALIGDQDAVNDKITSTFSSGQFSYGTDNAIGNPLASRYRFANSTACSSSAPSQPTYNWIDVTNQLTLPAAADDAFTDTIKLPWAFPFYGVGYKYCWASTNGLISFLDPNSQLNAGAVNNGNTAFLAFPAAGGFNSYIAAAMTDLDFTASRYPDAKIYAGVNPNNPDEFVITFWHAHKFYPTVPANPDYVTFQVIFKNGDRFPFKIQWNPLESTADSQIPGNCAVGAENAAGTQGFAYRLAGNRGAIFGPTPIAMQAEEIKLDTVKLRVKAFLSCVTSTGLMPLDIVSNTSTFINSCPNFPLSDPYDVSFNGSFIHVNNPTVATTSPLVLSTTGNDAIIDWVFLELRKGTPGSTTVYATKSALIQADGDIVDIDGISPVTFPGVSSCNCFVRVRHHNHLGFSTPTDIPVTPYTQILDFATTNSTIYGTGQQLTSLTPSVFAMNGGDANSDGSIDAFDTIEWELQNGLFGDYWLNADYNMDGSVDALDSIIWELTNGLFEEVP